MHIVGLDLAGKDKNPSGICFLTDDKSKTKLLYSDSEIMKEIKEFKPNLIAIDAPFSFPAKGMWRKSDRLLKKRGFRPLSPEFPGMKPLVRRAKRLRKNLKKLDVKIIEVFPRATEKILGLEKAKRRNQDEYDSLLCALTGKKYLAGKYENLDGLIIPKS